MVVEPVQLERLHQRRDVLLRGEDARIVGAAHQARHHQRGEHAHDHDDDHDFNQREGTAAPGMA